MNNQETMQERHTEHCGFFLQRWVPVIVWIGAVAFGEVLAKRQVIRVNSSGISDTRQETGPPVMATTAMSPGRFTIKPVEASRGVGETGEVLRGDGSAVVATGFPQGMQRRWRRPGKGGSTGGGRNRGSSD